MVTSTLLAVAIALAQSTPASGGVDPPPGYVIGIDDLLTVGFRGEPETIVDVVVRFDGMISVPLLNDIPAAGVTLDEFRRRLAVAGEKHFKLPTPIAVLKELRSRKVFISGVVAKPGAHLMSSPLTVMQLIAIAGGLGEYAKRKDITIIRPTAEGKTEVLKFNYDDVSRGRRVEQNVTLKVGDTVVVP